MTTKERPLINVPNLCPTHLSLFVHGARARVDANVMRESPAVAAQMARNIACETVRSFLAQAGVEAPRPPAPPPQT